MTDGVIILQNDHLQQACKDRFHLKNVSFHDLNFLIATYLSVLLLPTRSLMENTSDENTTMNSYVKLAFGKIIRNNTQTTVLWYDILRHLIPHPAMKFLQIYYTPMVRTVSLNSQLTFRHHHQARAPIPISRHLSYSTTLQK